MSETEQIDLAPLDELIALGPKIEQAQQRARLGSALQKATANVEQWSDLPARLSGLAQLLGASGARAEQLAPVAEPLTGVFAMARVMSAEPTVEDLDRINQVSFTTLPFQVEKIEGAIEGAWRISVADALAGQGALGRVLRRIPGVESLGDELAQLAQGASALIDRNQPVGWRITERDCLANARADLSERLQAAGIATEVAAFLVAVADGPVSLSALSEPVLGWLRDHEALAMFEVSAFDG